MDVMPVSRLHRTKYWLCGPQLGSWLSALCMISYLNPSPPGPASRLGSFHARGKSAMPLPSYLCAAACGHTGPSHFVMLVTMSDVEEQWGFQGFEFI
jgi:hypothetical protein